MTEIKPFKSIMYNQEKVGDLSKITCPPYDVISKDQQAKFHSLSPHNFIHVLLGKEKPKDDGYDNKYTRAKKIFENWLQEGVVGEDEKESLYFYKQEYKVMGQKHSRLGFIAVMKLLDETESKIYPHENTHARAKEDRLRLWSDLKSNLSPIFVCFSDKGRRVETIFNKHLAIADPHIDLIDEEKVRHMVWRLEDPALIKKVQESLANQEIFIADGHHRYEVAQQYRKTRMKGKPKADSHLPFNYVMTYFTNMDSKDLKIFPIHRIIKNIQGSLDFFEDLFRIDKVKTKDELMILLAKAGKNEYAFGFYTKKGIKLLRLKNKLLIDEHIKEGSREYRHLDAIILKNLVLDRLGIVSDDIIYEKDFKEATRMVDEGEADACFLMNPVKIQQIKAIALNGEKMPPKTTYFYPKVLSGLTVNRIE